MPRMFAALAAAAFFAAACNESAPVLPTQPLPPGVPSVVVTVTADSVTLTAGSQTTITITARQQDGSAVPDNSPVSVNTSLGHFGLDGSGAPQKLVTATLAGGSAKVTFYAGSEAGTANLIAQMGTSVGRLNLAIAQPPVAPVADFSFEVAGMRALFTDLSTGPPSKWKWDFGDGSDKSTSASPTHDYSKAGSYTVVLTVENGGGSSSKSKFVTVAAPPPLVASFTSKVNGLSVLFTDTSTGAPATWEWNFGDNKFDMVRNPQHAYVTGGTYTVTLTVRGGGQVSTAREFVTVGGAPPVADFQFHTDGLQVFFVDASTGAPVSWQWDFGDGKPVETVQNPSHVYDAAGTYTVTLKAFNVAGSAQKSQLVTVSKGDPPKASFTSQVVGLDAAFTDTSTGAPTSWEWNFGDNSAADKRPNPTHHYSTAGTFTVSLKVSNAAGESTVSHLVTTVAAPVAAFNATFTSQDTLKVSFIDQSSGSPTAWQWNFGDCAAQASCTSALRNPVHDYLSAGRYTVVLTVSNTAGQSTKQSTVRAGSPIADFSYAKNGLQVTFTDQSLNAPTSWLWTFGDCASCTSTEQNPVHIYSAPGQYNVLLRVTNAADTAAKPQLITVP